MSLSVNVILKMLLQLRQSNFLSRKCTEITLIAKSFMFPQNFPFCLTDFLLLECWIFKTKKDKNKCRLGECNWLVSACYVRR